MTDAPEEKTTAPIALHHCGHRDCPRFAQAALVMLVPFKGQHVNDMEPLQLFLGFELCLEHARLAKVSEFTNPDMERAVIRATLEAGRPNPDFSRAIMGGRPLDDPKYLAFKEMRARVVLPTPEPPPPQKLH